MLGVIVALQSVQPAFACNCGGHDAVPFVETDYFETEYVEVEYADSCECEVRGPVVESTVEVEESRGCGIEAKEESASDPVPAKTKKQESSDATVATPTPSLDDTEGELPPAPINVPSDPATTSSTDELFPGPAGTESEGTSTPAATPAAPSSVIEPAVIPPAETMPADNQTPESSSTGTEGLFDEPVTPPASTPSTSTPATDPADEVPYVETPSSTESSSSTDELFTEPSQSTEEPSTTETDPATSDTMETSDSTENSDSPESEESEPAGSPLDELFGPSTTTEEPQIEEPKSEEPKTEEPNTESSDESETEEAEPMEVFDPFSKLDQPREFRTWTDRTAAEQTEGRLVRMNAGGVVVAQVSGRLVSLTFSQLSDADLEFVRDCVRIERAQLAAEAAGARVASK